MPTEHPRRIGPYEVLGVLGKGAMGTVYKAVQPSLNRVVAVKVLPKAVAEDDEQVERFNREAQAVALLNHPNVVQIIDKDQDDGHLYFVMEYVPGTSLDAIMRQRRLSLPEALRVLKGVCLGLQASHRENVIHRDLNPRNVLVSEDLAVVKLADFGISRVESISREMGTLSGTMVSMGTLHYMAPEQASDMASTDHRSDIYSVGVLIYEMLTGRVPVGRFNLPSQINSEVPGDVDAIVLKCLATEPEKRYSSVTRLLADVERLEDRLRLGLVNELRGISRGTSKIVMRSTRRLVRGSKSRRGLAAAAVALVALTALAGLLLARRLAPAAKDRVQVVAYSRDSAADGEIPSAALEEVEPPSPEGDPNEPPAGAAAAVPATPAPAPQRTEPASPPTAAAPVPVPAVDVAEDLRVISDKIDAELYAPALADLEELLVRHGEAPLAIDAFFLKARIHQEQGDLQAVKADLVEIASRFSGAPRAAEAQYGLAEIAAREKGRENQREAQRLFAEVVAAYPKSEWAPRALWAKAEIETEEKLRLSDPELGREVPAALVTYRSLVNAYPHNPLCESGLWKLGELYEDEKDFKRAAAAFNELGVRFPATRSDAWWKVGQIFDRKLDDKERAMAAYSRVPESSQRYADARKRMAKLSG